jgi:hypothetical protein
MVVVIVISSPQRSIVIVESEGMWKEIVVAYFIIQRLRYMNRYLQSEFTIIRMLYYR